MTDKALWPRALPDKCANPLKSSKPIPSKPFILARFSNSHFTASTQTSPQFPGPKKNAAIFLHQHLAGIPFSHVIALKNKPLGADAKIAQVAELICWISPLCLTSKAHCHNVRTQSSSSPWKVYCLSFFVVWQKKKKKTRWFPCTFLMTIAAYQMASVIFMSLQTDKALKGKKKLAHSSILPVVSRSQGVRLMNKPTVRTRI